MASKNRSGERSAADGSGPPTSRRAARQQRHAGRDANPALARAGSRGADGGGRGPLMLWSVVFVAVAVAVVGAAFLISQSKSGSSGGPIAPGVLTPASIPANGRTLGNSNAAVTIDLYGDFRCTGCYMFTTGGIEQNIVSDYVATGKARLVWHDLLTIDSHDGTTASRDAANAAWCAADQGKFWVMHDWLYANQSSVEAASAFTKSRLSDIGKAAGLDMSSFQPCLDQGTHNAAIAAEQTARPADATVTPSVYVNGKLVSGGSYADIKAALDAALG